MVVGRGDPVAVDHQGDQGASRPSRQSRTAPALVSRASGGAFPTGVEGGRITEVKDVDYVYRSRQFRDYLGSGLPVDLMVGPDTVVSQPLQKALQQSGGSVMRGLGQGVYVPY